MYSMIHTMLGMNYTIYMIHTIFGMHYTIYMMVFKNHVLLISNKMDRMTSPMGKVKDETLDKADFEKIQELWASEYEEH